MGKVCTKCKQYDREFHKNRSKPDGLDNVCKQCRSKYHTKRDNERKKIARNENIGYHKTRSRMGDFLGRMARKSECEELLGCSLEEYEELISLWLKEKGIEIVNNEWSTKWHIDHIVPFNNILEELNECETIPDKIQTLKRITYWKNTQVLTEEEHKRKHGE